MSTTTPPPPTVTSPPPAPPDRSGRSLLWVLAGIAGLVVLGAGALAAAAWLVEDVERDSTTVATAATIRFRGDATALTLLEADRPDVEVVWEARSSPWREARVAVERTDGTVEVTVNCSGSLLGECSTDVQVTVPTGSLATLDATVDVGELRLVGTSAEVVASTDVGEITLADHRGTRAVLRTDVGSVQVDAVAVPSEVDAQVGVGDIEITLPDADYDVDASADVGSATTSVRQVDGTPHRVTARADVGDVNVVMR